MKLFGDGRRSLLLRPSDISASIVRPFVNPFCTIFLTLSLCNTSACRFRALDAPCRLYQPLLVAVAADVTGGRFLGYQGGYRAFEVDFALGPRNPASWVRVRGSRPRSAAPLPAPAASRSGCAAPPWPSHPPCPAPCPARLPALCVRGPWAAPGSVWVRAVWPAAVCCAWPHGLPGAPGRRSAGRPVARASPAPHGGRKVPGPAPAHPSLGRGSPWRTGGRGTGLPDLLGRPEGRNREQGQGAIPRGSVALKRWRSGAHTPLGSCRALRSGRLPE